jgi:hypothetical protein
MVNLYFVFGVPLIWTLPLFYLLTAFISQSLGWPVDVLSWEWQGRIGLLALAGASYLVGFLGMLWAIDYKHAKAIAQIGSGASLGLYLLISFVVGDFRWVLAADLPLWGRIVIVLVTLAVALGVFTGIKEKKPVDTQLRAHFPNEGNSIRAKF